MNCLGKDERSRWHFIVLCSFSWVIVLLCFLPPKVQEDESSLSWAMEMGYLFEMYILTLMSANLNIYKICFR